MDFLDEVAQCIADATGGPFVARARRETGGGCINDATVLSDGTVAYFVKHHRGAGSDMFAAEADGLAEIARSATVRVPNPIVHGAAQGRAFLVLEHLDLSGGGHDEALGRALAAMHRVTAPRYGWHRDNTIGTTPQPNDWSDDWVEFLRARRLGHQLELALTAGAGARLRKSGEELLDRIADFFTGYMPAASLLHGDLWSGNAAATVDGEPVIFDPAVYYGDREADLAMTELFGGFGPRFYAAYNEAWPLDAGYSLRKHLYNLYHVLNHYNLFGGSYLAQAERLTERLLGELR